MNHIEKELIVSKMTERMNALQKLIDRDISGNTQATLEAWREVKYWKEAISRGEFDIKIWED